MGTVSFFLIFVQVSINYPMIRSISIALKICMTRIRVFHHSVLFGFAATKIIECKQA